MSEAIRVLIVDDSAIVRRAVKTALAPDKEIQVLDTAANGEIALKKVEELKPDVVVLDIEMPVCDGFGVLRELRKRRLRVWTIMFSTLTDRGASQTIQALALGAHDYVPKPTSSSGINGYRAGLDQVARDLIPKIKRFKKSLPGRVKSSPGVTRNRVTRVNGRTARPGLAEKYSLVAHAEKHLKMSCAPDVLAIGISTGGPEALEKFLSKLPQDFPVPIVIVQHMPALFTKFLADRLSEKSKITVVEGSAGTNLKPGCAYIAPGDYHMTLRKTGTWVSIILNQNAPENSCRPAVDVLFRSVAEIYGNRALALIMTGMGQDGLKGLQVMKKKGASVIAQDEDTSVVWGMPGAAVQAGLADVVLPITELAGEIEYVCRPRARRVR